jgi:PTS system sucrose-specific IIC component
MIGLHQGLLPIKALFIAQYGAEFTTPIECCANTAQGIAALTVLLFINRSKKETTSQVASGGISAVMGITEPAIFSVNIRMLHCFLGAMIGAAIGGY